MCRVLSFAKGGGSTILVGSADDRGPPPPPRFAGYCARGGSRVRLVRVRRGLGFGLALPQERQGLGWGRSAVAGSSAKAGGGRCGGSRGRRGTRAPERPMVVRRLSLMKFHATCSGLPGYIYHLVRVRVRVSQPVAREPEPHDRRGEPPPHRREAPQRLHATANCP